MVSYNKLVNEKLGFKLYAPQHSWDTNYYLIDSWDRWEYLIDIHDIYDGDSVEEMYDNGGILWDDLKELSDISDIIHISWRMKEL